MTEAAHGTPGAPEFDELPPYLVPHSQATTRIVYEDTDLLIVDKPHHLLSVPGRHPLNHDSLIRRLQPRYPDVNAVHRLDLDTSGIMVVPKHKASLSELARQFQRRQIEKEYTAVLWGELDQDAGAVELPIATDWPNRPKQMICHERGKHSLTYFEVIERRKDADPCKTQTCHRSISPASDTHAGAGPPNYWLRYVRAPQSPRSV